MHRRTLFLAVCLAAALLAPPVRALPSGGGGGTPDLVIDAIYLSDGAEDRPNAHGVWNEVSRTVYTAGNELLLSLWSITNRGDADYADHVVLYAAALYRQGESAPIRTADGGCVDLSCAYEGARTLAAGQSIAGAPNDCLSLGTLAAGAYTLRVTLETEAFCAAEYTGNNSMDVAFTVAEPCALQGASLSVAGAAARLDDAHASLPLLIDGLDEDFAAQCVLSVFYSSSASGGWLSTNDACEVLPFCLQPCARVPTNATRVRVRLLLQPRADGAQPWPVLETVVTGITSGELDGTRVAYSLYLLSGELALTCRHAGHHLFAAGYDADGRMVFLSPPCDAAHTNRFTVDPAAAQLRLFWFDASGVPQHSAVQLNGRPSSRTPRR
ncbi:MAG: hypothetical protein K6G54_00875 [Oscillospiraceae bacterium]|nr:hypothetical protein [Oscillospiraceae bacterium]